MESIGPKKDEDETSIVMNCPVCHRTIWRNAKCYHGQPPDGKDDNTPKESDVAGKRKHLRGGL